jgi:2'-5' RNA ligase
VAAHFTLVFGCKAFPEEECTQLTRLIAQATKAIPFSCRYATLGTDDFDADTAQVLLVPDEGYAGISLLHHKLYTGILEPFLRLDVPFVPHITIGTMKDRSVAKSLCDDLNRDGTRIDGQVRSLTIGALEDGKLLNLSRYQLGA